MELLSLGDLPMMMEPRLAGERKPMDANRIKRKVHTTIYRAKEERLNDELLANKRDALQKVCIPACRCRRARRRAWATQRAGGTRQRAPASIHSPLSPPPSPRPWAATM